ncbi:hypothetical protein JXM67_00430 [candidate division WOR-3 bacterium]|nr:hypothetical protein [candidate division WOR-3 bacterium]
MSMFFALLILAGDQDVRETDRGLEIKTVIDYEAGLVYYEEWIDSFYLGVLDVDPLDEYLTKIERGFSEDELKRRMREERGKADIGGNEGIIPDIKIQMGEEWTDVDVGGQDKITLGTSFTRFDRDTLDLDEDNGSASPLSGIKLEQNLNVSVIGTIARKTKVEINHSSGGSELFSDNKVRLSYTGDDDEIVKKIEAGDVALNLPSGQSIPSHQGLFGINAQVQLGPVDLYAVASREETKAGTEEYKGKTQIQAGEHLDRDYIDRKYFYVFHEGLRDSLKGQDINTNQISVFVAGYSPGFKPQDKTPFPGWASPFADTSLADSLFDADEVEYGMEFFALEPGPDKDYEILPYPDGFVIQLTSRLSQNFVLAVACTTSTGLGFGGVLNPDTLEETPDTVGLLLVWGENPYPDDLCWTNMRRNHYSLPGNLPVKEIKVKVSYLDNSVWKSVNKNGTRYSYILGLTDSNSNVHTLNGNGSLFEDGYEVQLAELIFEEPYPFTNPELDERVDSIYWSRDYDDADVGGKYKIEYEYESLVASFDLGPFIKDQSVKVYVNDRELEEDEFSVNYQVGTVKIEKVISPEDDIKITFEQKEVFALDRKSLLGFRAESRLAEGIKVGGSFLYRKVGLSSEGKPTLVMEPYSRTVGELDLSVNRDLDFLTKFLDWLPVISTETPSQFTLTGNSAISLPNPNTHKSESVWLDDFESTRESRSVDLSPPDWYITSLPLGPDTMPLDTAYYSRDLPRWELSDKFWKGNDIYGDEELDDPTQASPTDQATIISWTENDPSRWSGIISHVPTSIPMDLTEAENLELIIKTGNEQGVLHFDFGSDIDQDQLRLNKDDSIVGWRTGSADTEDKYSFGNLNAGEDTGLDTLSGEDGTGVSGDDGNDDYEGDKTKADYNPNGTEGNSKLDSEDFLLGRFNDYKNNYYELNLDLTDQDFISEYVDSLGPEGDRTGWIRVSVPLTDTSLYRIFNSPDMSEVSMLRVWFEGMNNDMEVWLYSWDFVGNKWADPGAFAFDSTEVDSSELVFIDVIGTQNSDYEKLYHDERGMNNQILQENALQMMYENIGPAHGARATRMDFFPSDFRGYKRVKLYVHNDDNDPEFYLRMGTDSLAYYEVRSRISEGSVPPYAESQKWREFTFELDDLINLKYENDTILIPVNDTVFQRPVVVSADGLLRVRGMPSFSAIKYFELGILNEEGVPITGEVWFNDIRLEGPYRETGTNLSLSGSLRLADLANISANYSTGNGRFTSLVALPGPLVEGENRSAGLNTTVNLEKFGLDRLGFKLPLNYNFSNSTNIPRFDGAMPDYRLDEAEQEVRKGFSTSHKLAVSFTHSQKGKKKKLIEYTLDALSGGASYNSSSSLGNSGLMRDTSFSQNYDLTYSINPDLSFKLFGEKISYFPKTLSFSTFFNKKNALTEEKFSFNDSQSVKTPSKTTSLTWNSGISYTPIKFLPLTASLNETRSRLSDVWINDLLDEPYYSRSLSLSASLANINFKKFGRPTVGAGSSFTEDRSWSLHKQIFGDTASTETVRNLNNSGSVSFGWSGFDLGGMVGASRTRLQKRFENYKKELKAQDTLKTAPPDTSKGEQSAMGQIPADSLAVDSLGSDSLDVDSLPRRPVDEKALLYEARIQRMENLEKIGKVLQPVAADVKFTRNSAFNTYQDVFGWADDWGYVAGLVDTLRVDTSGYDTTRLPWSSRGWGWDEHYKLSSGLNLGQIRITGYVQHNFNKSLQSLGEMGYTKSTTLPSLSFNYSQLGKLLEKWATSSQLTASVSRVISVDGTEGIPDSNYSPPNDSGPVSNDQRKPVLDTTRITKELNFTPLLSWNTTWKNQITSNVSINYGISSNMKYRDESWDTTISRGGLVSLSYTFSKPSGFKLPILKHIKFENDLTLTGTINYDEQIKTSSTVVDEQGDVIEDVKTITTKGIFEATYTFSKAFDGGFNFGISRYTNELTPDNNRTDVDFNLFVVFKF